MTQGKANQTTPEQEAVIDEQLCAIISKVKRGETVTAFTVVYVLRERTGQNIGESVISASLERLFSAGRIERRLTYKNEAAYYGIGGTRHTGGNEERGNCTALL